ncbi:carboxylesterase/lipase family protein [Thalassotalea agarivorans]|uniref:Carboxylic ester hydrolase n=1 Tax=Thalassotalea agarivorans TaxID=349064 RepID=A0A1I0DMW7_THASX|nr:carboxylesterase family protein [Thalassotalea agarivorans]SET33865.1 para-nitrobenzyl esterase [Thalassotalea agarivorans]
MALKTFFLISGLCFSAIVFPQESLQKNQTQVATAHTLYEGKVSNQNTNVISFKGIAYAKPPVGPLRWKKPQPISQYPKVTLADTFKSACYQDDYNIDWYKDVASRFGKNDLVMSMPNVSEDCLYLNIWKPLNTNLSPLPVMVWIHGGSNKAGWSYEPNYLGHNLAEKGNVIVISVAYRLGVFGFLAHSQFNQSDGKANFALHDQIAALHWIKQNISAFGGDANNITLFGESAGAANIGYLMAIPSANQLFNKAISQSGAFQLLANSDLREAQSVGNKLSKQLSSPSIEHLRTVPAETVWQAMKQIAPDYDYRAIVDNELFVDTPQKQFANQSSQSLLIGTNLNEFLMYQEAGDTAPVFDSKISSKTAQALILEKFNKIKDKRLALDWFDNFQYMACSSAILANAVNQQGGKAWLYRFDRVREGGEAIKAYHGAEIPYVFDSHDSWLPTNKADTTLTDIMMKAWVTFAKTGSPQSMPLMSDWLPYTFEQPSMFVFDEKSVLSGYADSNLCQQLEPIYLN